MDVFGAEIASVQSHAESAMQQLAAVREQEQLQLTRRAEALQRDFRESIAELEHRYALQVRCRKQHQLLPKLCYHVSCSMVVSQRMH